MNTIIDRLRGWPWLVAAILLLVAIGWLAPHQIGVLVWSLAKLSLGAYLGYWIDRSIFPYARPHELQIEWRTSAMLRRAIIVAASIVSLGLGL